jgi:hypothetical protein
MRASICAKADGDSSIAHAITAATRRDFVMDMQNSKNMG